VAAVIDAFPLVPDVATQIGNNDGILFTHLKGATGLDTVMPIASATKWWGGVLVMAVVEAGLFDRDLDTRVYDVLEWWPSDAADPRSRITLRHTAAFITGFDGAGANCNGLDVQQCARAVLENGVHVHEPGTYFSYNSEHFRIAGAMVEQVTGLSLLEAVREYIFSRTEPPMLQSTFSNTANPSLAGGGITTPSDYQAFMSAYFGGALVSLPGRAVIESDQCPSCEACAFCGTTGHYGLGAWAECLGWALEGRGWTTQCARSQEFSSAGAFGYWPGVDTARDFYFHFAMQQDVLSAAALKALVKPVMDAVLDGDQVAAQRIAQASIARMDTLELRAAGDLPPLTNRPHQ
jgi:CubicO group peptidase (beta-lactamase class C family)